MRGFSRAERSELERAEGCSTLLHLGPVSKWTSWPIYLFNHTIIWKQLIQYQRLRMPLFSIIHYAGHLTQVVSSLQPSHTQLVRNHSLYLWASTKILILTLRLCFTSCWILSTYLFKPIFVKKFSQRRTTVINFQCPVSASLWKLQDLLRRLLWGVFIRKRIHYLGNQTSLALSKNTHIVNQYSKLLTNTGNTWRIFVKLFF